MTNWTAIQIMFYFRAPCRVQIPPWATVLNEAATIQHQEFCVPLKTLSLFSFEMCIAAWEHGNEGGVDEGDGGIEVFREAAAATDPGGQAFHHRASRVCGEADLPLGPSNDLGADGAQQAQPRQPPLHRD